MATRSLRTLEWPLVAAAASLVLLSASPARADDMSDLESVLEQKVVTTASHTAETTAAAPATTSVITAEDIRRHGIRSLNEALNYLSLGMFTTNPLHGVEIGARGVLIGADYGNHVLLLVDGHAINEPYGGSASFDRGLGVPMELIDHVEVVLGPGAVLYGSNAMLGVVNVVTKRAKDHHGIRIYGDSELFVWGKLGASVGTQLTFLGRPVELVAHVEHQQQDGPSFTFAPQDVGTDAVTGLPKRFGSGAGTGIWGGTARSSYYSKSPSAYVRVVTGNLEVAIKASSYQRATPYLDGLIQYVGDFDTSSNYELERWLSADVKYRIPVSAVFDLKTRFYADMYTYDWYVRTSAAEDCLDGQLGGCRRNLRALSRWTGAEVRGTFDWLRNGRFVSMFGTDARYERIDAATTMGALVPTEPSGRAGEVATGNLRLGAYTQQTLAPTTWLSLNAGLRADVAEGYPGALSPRAVVAVSPWKGGTLKAIYSQAFRAPSSYERAWEDPYTLQARDLRPERVHAKEASFEQQLGAHRLLVGAFHSIWTDLVQSVPLTADEITAARQAGQPIADELVGQYRNGGMIRSYGFNAGAEGSVLGQRWRYGLNITGAYARQRRAGEDSTPMAVIPSFFGNVRTSYDLGGSLPTLAIAAQFANRRPADRAFDGGFAPMPYAPPTLELRAALTGPIPGITGLSYRVTANYAFQDTGPYVIGPIQSGDYGVPATLNPIDRFRTGIGLQYVIDP